MDRLEQLLEQHLASVARLAAFHRAALAAQTGAMNRPDDGRDPSVKAATPSSNPDGPAPYQEGALDTVTCPNCAFMVDPGDFCDQCGYDLTGHYPSDGGFDGGVSLGASSGEPPDRRPGQGDLVQCPSCGGWGQLDGVFCRWCGRNVPAGAFAAALNGASPPLAAKTASSSALPPGVRRRGGIWDYSDSEFLRAWDGTEAGPGDDLDDRLDSVASQLDAVAADLDDSTRSYYAARSGMIEHFGGDPDEAAHRAIARQDWLDDESWQVVSAYFEAERRWKGDHRRYDAISARQSEMLGDLYEYEPGYERPVPVNRAGQGVLRQIDRSADPPLLNRGDLRPIDRSRDR